MVIYLLIRQTACIVCMSQSLPGIVEYGNGNLQRLNAGDGQGVTGVTVAQLDSLP